MLVVNRFEGRGLKIASGMAYKRRNLWLYSGLAAFATISLVIGLV